MSKENMTVVQIRKVKTAWGQAPAGPKKDAALKHHQAAEKARKADNDEEAHKVPNVASSLCYLSKGPV